MLSDYNKVNKINTSLSSTRTKVPPMPNSINQESDFTDEGDCYGTLTTGYGRIYDDCGEQYYDDEYDEDYEVSSQVCLAHASRL